MATTNTTTRNMTTLEGWRGTGEGPPFLQFGRAIRYARSDVEAYEAAHKFRNTAEASEAAK
jgi:hypothetical protein